MINNIPWGSTLKQLIEFVNEKFDQNNCSGILILLYVNFRFKNKFRFLRYYYNKILYLHYF